MRNFSYTTASNPAEALALTGQNPGKYIAGGTDLLPLMKEGLASPENLVDISQWREGRTILVTDDGIRIGSLATLAEIAAHPQIRENYTALSDACSLSAAPQLRHMGTIGGNLLQATRCWYYRGPYNCWLKGGEKCYARTGENELHSIFHTSPQESICVSASPSDPATALLALEATVTYQTAAGSADIPISDFFRLPTADNRTTVSLPEDALITSINIPRFRGTSLYRTVMSRATWTFALAGVALGIRTEQNLITHARVSVGGVAPIPIRMPGVEQAMQGRSLSAVQVDELTRLLVENAQPLSGNGYKITLLTGLFKEAFAALA